MKPFRVQAPMANASSPTTLLTFARFYASHASTQWILVFFVLTLGYRIHLGGFEAADLWAGLSVFLVWPFFEWVFHILMHAPPPRVAGREIELEPVRKHRLHHIDPTVPAYTLLPVSAVWLLGTVAIAGFSLAFGVHTGLTAALCFMAGGFVNGWVHLLTHTRYRPKSRYFRWVRRIHYLHHFKNEHYWFAFTGPHVDHVLRTARAPKSVSSSPACQARVKGEVHGN